MKRLLTALFVLCAMCVCAVYAEGYKFDLRMTGDIDELISIEETVRMYFAEDASNVCVTGVSDTGVAAAVETRTVRIICLEKGETEITFSFDSCGRNYDGIIRLEVRNGNESDAIEDTKNYEDSALNDEITKEKEANRCTTAGIMVDGSLVYPVDAREDGEYKIPLLVGRSKVGDIIAIVKGDTVTFDYWILKETSICDDHTKLRVNGVKVKLGDTVTISKKLHGEKLLYVKPELYIYISSDNVRRKHLSINELNEYATEAHKIVESFEAQTEE